MAPVARHWALALACGASVVWAGESILVKLHAAFRDWDAQDTRGSSPLAAAHRRAGAARIEALTGAGARDPALVSVGLDRVYVVTLREGVRQADALATYVESGLVEHAVPNHCYRIHLAARADSLEPQQWALSKIRARAGWDLERGKREVVVAIVDTGVDYRHPDLAANVWINEPEDLNGNSSFDPWPVDSGGDLDGRDNDGNGYVDDVVGWDFVDAPEMPGAGDWTGRDNDPMDEGPSSHGTHVAGIACAVADNGIGIAGVAPGCRIMALRAGFGPLGYLQEDDVASAIIYAVQNGAKVVNMSWGDVVVSPIIRDVLTYASARGCVLVASAGNAGSDAPHFPSGYPETISVGNSTPQDLLAPNSSFGPSLDVVAPGTSILSTFIGGGYGTLSGTSMAAPHVSGLAALLCSRFPHLDPEGVRAAIRAGAVDLGPPGRDDRFGAGRIDVPASLAGEPALVVHLLAPSTGTTVAPPTAVVGTVAGPGLWRWELQVGWGGGRTVVAEGSGQVVGDTLAMLDPSPPGEGPCTLWLKAWDRAGTTREDVVSFQVDRTAPVVVSMAVQPVLEGPHTHYLVELSTDDVCWAAISVQRPGSGAALTYPLPYVTRDHRWLMGPQTPGPGTWEWGVEVSNEAGLSSWVEGLGPLTVDDTPQGWLWFREVERALPPGWLVPSALDFDGDGRKEIAVGTLVPSAVPGTVTLGPMRIFEEGAGGFVEVPCGVMKMYPLAAGDADRDGLVELLGTYVSQARAFTYYLWEPEYQGGFPSRISWADSSHVLAVGMADTDGDGWGEVFAIDQSRYPRHVVVASEAVGNDLFQPRDTLWGPEGQDFVPRAFASADLDGDGLLEVALGTSRGGVVVFRRGGADRWVTWWSGLCSLGDEAVVHGVACGDVDGDLSPELLTLARLDLNLNLEHNLDARRWALDVYRTGAQGPVRVAHQVFWGAITETALNSVSTGDLDGDGRDEVYVCVHPDYYVLGWGPRDSLEVAWYLRGASTSSTVVGPWVVVGMREETVVFSEGRQLPPPPSWVEAIPWDEHTIHVTWAPVRGAQAYRVWRGVRPDSLGPVAVVGGSPYADSSVVAAVTYWYGVSSIDSAYVPAEGPVGRPVSCATHQPPRPTHVQWRAPSHVELVFSAPLDQGSARDPSHYDLGAQGLVPSSIAMVFQERGVLLGFRGSLPQGEHLLRWRGLRAWSGMPLPPDSAWVWVEAAPPFYLRQARYVGGGAVEIWFSRPPAPGLSPERFRVDPPLSIRSLQVDQAEPWKVLLSVDPPWRTDGTAYVLSATDLQAEDGTPLHPSGSSVSFTFFAESAGQCHPVPNPWVVGRPRLLRFVGAPPDASLSLFDLAGRLVARLREGVPDGVVEWDGQVGGRPLPAGALVYRVDSSLGESRGVLVILR